MVSYPSSERRVNSQCINCGGVRSGSHHLPHHSRFHHRFLLVQKAVSVGFPWAVVPILSCYLGLAAGLKTMVTLFFILLPASYILAIILAQLSTSRTRLEEAIPDPNYFLLFTEKRLTSTWLGWAVFHPKFHFSIRTNNDEGVLVPFFVPCTSKGVQCQRQIPASWLRF